MFDLCRVIYENREFSWLKFNDRVLKQALREGMPLLESLNFEAIFFSNFDEFFMSRVGTLVNASLEDDKAKDSRTKLRPSEQLQEVLRRSHKLFAQADTYFFKTQEALSDKSIIRLNFESLTDEQKAYCKNYFLKKIKPNLNIFCGIGLPFLDGLKIYAACQMKNDANMLGVISFDFDNGIIERIVKLPESNGKFEYILAEELILAYLHFCFEEEISERALVRVTRNGDIKADREFNGEADPVKAMTKMLSQRRIMQPVRLQIYGDVTEFFTLKLSHLLELSDKQLFHYVSPLDLKYVNSLKKLFCDQKDLFYPPLSPKISPDVPENIRVIDAVRQRDILLSYPYESMESFIKLLEDTANDENVKSIKITLYRAAKNSKVVKALCRAAQNGKQVTVCVELRARFDEENNLQVTTILEQSGCKVLHGVNGYKVHAKLCLIEFSNGLNIIQIGTGNYNEETAKGYTDFSFLTSKNEIAVEARAIFDMIEAGKLNADTNKFMLAPRNLQTRILDMLDEQIELQKRGFDGYFGAKMNGLSDMKIIDKMIEASKAGVKIDLIIRGICCIKAGVEGFTDNIHIVSIVGRFLEHSRVYIFGTGENLRIFISSADLMTRNTCKRVEAAVEIEDLNVKKRILDYFNVQLNDTVNASIQINGEYNIPLSGIGIDSQDFFYKQAYEHEPKRDNHEAKIHNQKGFFTRLFERLFKRKIKRN